MRGESVAAIGAEAIQTLVGTLMLLSVLPPNLAVHQIET